MPFIEIERGQQRFDIISDEIILDTIIRYGGFVYAPRFWSEENDKIIEELVKSNIITQDNGEFNPLNPSYSYVELF